MRRFKVLVILLLAIILNLNWVTPSLAADFDYVVASTYTLDLQGKVKARVIIDVTNNVSTPTPSSLVLPLAGAPTDVVASYQDGGQINANYSADNQTLRLETAKSPAGSGNKWSVVVNYEADLVQQFGDTTILSVSPLDYGSMNITQETTTVEVDLANGVAIARGPSPNSTNIVAGKQVLRWVNDGDSIAEAVGVLFGDQAVADYRYETKLKNSSWWWKSVTVTLPPDTNQQQVFLEELNPTPSKLDLDVDGNILATYRLRPRQSIDVSARATIVVNNLSYALDSQSEISQTPTQIMDRYGALVGDWQDSDATVNIEGMKSADAIEAIYDSVVANSESLKVSYESALKLSNQLVGELRAQGIPARLVLGQVFGDGGSVFENPLPHAWVEAYAAGIGWMSVDPSFELAGEYFGSTDVQRIAIALRGTDPSYPPAPLEEVDISYTENDVPSIPEMIPELNGTNYVLLPFLSIRSASVQMPSGVIVDGSGLQIGDKQAQLLGSLAPLQKVSLRSAVFGPDAFSSDQLSYGVFVDGAIVDPIATGELKVSYVPMILLVTIGFLFFVVRWIWRRRSGSKKKAKRSRDAVVFKKEKVGEAIEETNLLPKLELIDQQPTNAPPPPPAQPAQSASNETPPYRSDTMSQTDESVSRTRRRPKRTRVQ